jgi:hypothetical protein
MINLFVVLFDFCLLWIFDIERELFGGELADF